MVWKIRLAISLLSLIIEFISADLDSNFGRNFKFNPKFLDSNQNIIASNPFINSNFNPSSNSNFQDPNEKIDHNLNYNLNNLDSISDPNLDLNLSSTLSPTLSSTLSSNLTSDNYLNKNESTNHQFDNCTRNPCVNGFCLINQTNPLGYNCYCKDGFTGYQCQIKYNECKQDFCKNGATCVQEEVGLVCFCKNGYKGKYCEDLIDNCSSSPCLNDGNCTNFVNGYMCTCKAGFNGNNCEKDVDVCEKSTCFNNGKCIEGLALNYTCECQPDYEGKHCETKIDRCKAKPCKNNGQCVTVTPADFRCNCPCDYTGRYCENKVMFCKEKDYCQNEGVCVIVEDHLISNSTSVKYEKNVCFCKPKNYGERCEFNYSKCLISGVICENNGTCLDSNELDEPFKCECKETYRGKYCELDCRQTGDCSSINNQFEINPSISFNLNEQTIKTAQDTPTLITEHLASTSFIAVQQDMSAVYFTNTIDTSSPQSLMTATFFIQPSYTVPSFKPTESFQTPYFNVTEKSKENQNGPNFNSLDRSLNDNQNSFNLTSKLKRIFSPKFNGRSSNASFLQFEKDKYELPASFVIHFDFSTNASDAVLFHTEAESDSIVFAIIYLENGLLKLSFSCNRQSTLYLISDKNYHLNNEQINHVQMHFRLNLKKGICESQIQLNNSLSINKNQTSSLPLNSKICFKYFNFGSKRSNNPYLPNKIPPFEGCLRNIYINNNLKLVKDAIRAESLEECNLNKICDLSPCGQHGQCSFRKESRNTINGPYDSRFRRSFTLKSFQNPDFFDQVTSNRKLSDKNLHLIDNDQLSNHKNQISSNNLSNELSRNDWICSCSPGYHGEFCETSSCENPNPCSGPSVCLLISNSQLSCVCPDSKFGDYCDLDFNHDAPRFSKESYMVFPVENRNNFIEIAFNFTSANLEQENALLLYMGQPQSTKKLNFFSLTLDKLFINFKINLAHRIKEIATKLSEHQNLHQVRLGYSGQFFWLSVDNQQKVEDHIYPLQESSFVEDRLYVGGHQLVRKVDRLIEVDFFEGCIFNVSIRTNQQNSSFYLMNKIITNYNIGKCEEIDCK